MASRSYLRRILLGAIGVGASFWSAHGRIGSDMTEEAIFGHRRALRPWNLIDGKHWELAAERTEDPRVTDETEGTRGDCPLGMVEVRGRMKLDSERGSIEALQDSTCTHWINHDFPARCEHFDGERWAAIARDLPTEALHFCIDRFEYPDVKGAYPVIMVSWHDAGALCAARSERLCTEDEWSFACEGEDALPYPTGYERDEKACVIDRPWLQYDDRALAVPASDAARGEIDFLWQGEASGDRPTCRSPFGVYDMTGNVDEWTRSTEREGFASIFKGGYWGPVRARCRASTRAHNEDFAFYQQGLRCCADAPILEDAQAPSE